jgi:hypothetical protein
MRRSSPEAVNEAFDLRGGATAVARAFGCDVRFDGTGTRELVDLRVWPSLADESEVRRAEAEWDIEDPTVETRRKVSFRCEIVDVADPARSYETALRVSGSRGDWYDLSPVRTDVVAPAGAAAYRVRIEARHGEAVFPLVDGELKNDASDLARLGPTARGKVFSAAPGCVLFCHWLGDSFAFVELALRCSPGPFTAEAEKKMT